MPRLHHTRFYPLEAVAVDGLSPYTIVIVVMHMVVALKSTIKEMYVLLSFT